MTLDSLREYCLQKPYATESMPFDDQVITYKIANKIFALTSFGIEVKVSLKLPPEMVIDLREKYESVLPGYHLNKKHWVTVQCDDGMLSEGQISAWIDTSYDTVIRTLSKKKQQELILKF